MKKVEGIKTIKWSEWIEEIEVELQPNSACKVVKKTPKV